MTTRTEYGYTLVELLVVIAIITLIAMVAVPSTSGRNSIRLTAATTEISDAIRFSRSEAMRLGVPHGFSIDASNKQIQLFRLNTGTIPGTRIYDVNHPVHKQPYVVAIDTHPFASADTLTAVEIYRGSCNSSGEIFFDARGVAWCWNPSTVMLDRYNITLLLGDFSSDIVLTGITGRLVSQ